MTESSAPDLIEITIFAGTKNDVVHTQRATMATEPSSVGPHTVSAAAAAAVATAAAVEAATSATVVVKNIRMGRMDSCGADGVSALSLNDDHNSITTGAAAIAAVTGTINTNTDRDMNLVVRKNMNMKAKRRRRKSKQKSNNKPYKKSNWKFQLPRNGSGLHAGPGGGNIGGCINGGMSTLVPYNTNKFLMEEHMPDTGRLTPSGRNRDSSFSVDSDENLYNEEEFLSKEFSSVYEDARSERLESMSKQQLIQEYLQLEANYDKLSKNLGARRSDYDNAKEVQRVKHFESQDVIRKLEERVKELTSENQDLRRQMADIRNRDTHQRSRSDSDGQRHSHHQRKRNHHKNNNHKKRNGHSISSGSEDSESDSSTDSSNSDSSSSRSSRSSHSKSSLSGFENNMMGIDGDDGELLINSCGQDDIPVNINGDHDLWPAMVAVVDDCDDNDKVMMCPLVDVSTQERYDSKRANNCTITNTRE